VYRCTVPERDRARNIRSKRDQERDAFESRFVHPRITLAAAIKRNANISTELCATVIECISVRARNRSRKRAFYTRRVIKRSVVRFRLRYPGGPITLERYRIKAKTFN